MIFITYLSCFGFLTNFQYDEHIVNVRYQTKNYMLKNQLYLSCNIYLMISYKEYSLRGPV